MATFRSLLVPLKAVIMNLLSIGAAYGVIVAVFQWGWLSGVLGVGDPGPIESWAPDRSDRPSSPRLVDESQASVARPRKWAQTGWPDDTTGEASMFVQVIEGRTSDPAGIAEHGERWQRELRPGAAGYLGLTAGTTADGRTIAIVRFEDEASARANSERPEQGAWFEGMAKLYDGEPTFKESSDVTEWMGGGSNDAGFVQVMKSTGVDRAQLEKMDEAFEPFAAVRPDLLGGIRIWTGTDSCIDVAYFTSEEEARKGEQAEMPDEMKELMTEFEGQGETEYLDLTAPQLR